MQLHLAYLQVIFETGTIPQKRGMRTVIFVLVYPTVTLIGLDQKLIITEPGVHKGIDKSTS